MPPAIALTPSTRKLSICSISSRNKSSSSKSCSVSTKDAVKKELLRKTKKKRCSGDTEERSVGNSSATTMSSITTMSSSSLFDPPDKRQIDRLDKCFDVSSHGTQKFLNKYLKLKSKEHQQHEDTIFIDQTRIEIKEWKECYRKAVDNAGVKAKRKYKGHIEEMARENERIRALIDKAHRYAAVIEKETDARSIESEKTIIALKYADEAHTKENDNIRKEVSTLKREADKPHLSAEDIMDMVAEKERAVSESKRLNKRMDFLVYFIECLKEQIARDVQLLEKEKQLNKSPSSVDETIKAQEEYETTVKRLQENASRAREELQTCREECDCALEEVDILRWKIRDRQSTLAQLNSQQQQPQPQPGVFERWFGF